MLFLFLFLFLNALINKSCISDHDHDMRSYLPTTSEAGQITLEGGGSGYTLPPLRVSRLAS
jgi:hypothetical protein